MAMENVEVQTRNQSLMDGIRAPSSIALFLSLSLSLPISVLYKTHDYYQYSYYVFMYIHPSIHPFRTSACHQLHSEVQVTTGQIKFATLPPFIHLHLICCPGTGIAFRWCSSSSIVEWLSNSSRVMHEESSHSPSSGDILTPWPWWSSAKLSAICPVPDQC